MQWFKLKNINSLFDSLYVKSGTGVVDGKISVEQMVNTDIMFGTNNFSISFPENCLSISEEFVETVDSPDLREFSHDNPWGKHCNETRYKFDELELVVSYYEKAVTAILWEPKTGQTKAVKNILTGDDFWQEQFAIEFERMYAQQGFNDKCGLNELLDWFEERKDGKE